MQNHAWRSTVLKTYWAGGRMLQTIQSKEFENAHKSKQTETERVTMTDSVAGVKVAIRIRPFDKSEKGQTESIVKTKVTHSKHS